MRSQIKLFLFEFEFSLARTTDSFPVEQLCETTERVTFSRITFCGILVFTSFT